jgi:hypothetical protein
MALSLSPGHAEPGKLVLQPPPGNACTLAPGRFGLIPFRSPLLGESRLISFPRGTEMFQFPRLPSFAPMYSARDDTALPVPGFPIRVSAGQSLFSSSPRLIAAVHALPRLLMPRHPPCALTILTVIVDSRRSGLHLAVGPCAGYNGDLERRVASKLALRRFPLFGQLCSFQGPARAQPGGLPGWSLKTQQCKPAGRAAKRRAGRAPGPVDVSGRRERRVPLAAWLLCEGAP